MALKAGMMVVIQLNVATKDGMAGVQTGEVLLITKTGVERLHGAGIGKGELKLAFLDQANAVVFPKYMD